MPSDTTPEAERVWIELWRKATPEERLQRAFNITATGIAISRGALARLHPAMPDQERNLIWAEVHYGRELVDRVRQHLGKR